jgi:uncharacterized protein with NRDE domain
MCLIIAAFQVNPAYPLIVAANREERRARPSTPPHLWPGEPPLWAGRDEMAGGTWLGVNARGLVASVTNRRTRPMVGRSRPRSQPRTTIDPSLPSRGLLCLQTLQQLAPATALIAARATLAQGPSNPFNLFCANATEGWVLDWRGKHWPLTPGIHLISNRGAPNDGRLGVIRRARSLLSDIDLTCASLDQLLANLAHLCANTEGRHPLCRAAGDFGTVSSSLIALDPNARIAAYQHANGPPCSVSYQSLDVRDVT